MDCSIDETRKRVSRLLVPLMLAAAVRVYAGGGGPTTCSSMCNTLTSTLCTVTSTVNIVAGSVIDCGERAVEVSGELRVHDARFELRAGSILVTSGGIILSDCPAGKTRHGFTLAVTDTITVASTGGSKLTALCDVAGGHISLTAGGAIAIGGNGINASGTATNGDGGRLDIDAGGAFSSTAEIKASVTGGVAEGGTIDIRADNVTIGAAIDARGTGATDGRSGGSISISTDNDLTISTGTFTIEASSSLGDGGSIELVAGGTIHANRPLKARGTGSGGHGGSVVLEAERIEVDSDINTTGGHDGGGVELIARGGPVLLGANTSTNFDIDVSGSGGDSGSVHITSGGSDVDVRASARLKATDGGSGPSGGRIRVAGVSLLTSSGSQIIADGPTGSTGAIYLTARDVLSLSGTVRPTNGSTYLVHRSGTPTIGSGVQTPYSLIADDGLSAACGDGIRRTGATTEACDTNDLGSATCVTQGYSGGPLACSSTCTFNVSGCVP